MMSHGDEAVNPAEAFSMSRNMAALGRRPHRVRCVCGELFEGHGNAKYCSEKCRAPAVRRWQQLSRRRNA